MARALREEYKGGIYHVIARGNNKEYIFKESIDKGYFIKQLKECSAAMGCRVYGYVLMGNHYHIIIQTLDKKLQEIMHRVNNKIASTLMVSIKELVTYFKADIKQCWYKMKGIC